MRIFDIVIPVYNGYECLEPLFISLKNHTNSPHRLIIINDSSSDTRISEFLTTLDQYKNQFCQEIILYNNEVNLGFVKSVNFAYTFTQGNFVILNTDTEVPDGWLDRLMQPIERDSQIASVTPLTNAGTICSFPRWLEDNSLAFGLSLDQLDGVFRDIDDKYLVETPTGVGFCMAINRQVVNQIGFFDAESFGHGYCEENDWCMRAKLHGYKNVIVRNLFVYHKHGGSFGSTKTYLINTNMKKLLIKYPSYLKEVEHFVNGRPMDSLFAIASFKSFLLHNPAVIFCHMWGGGSEHFIHEHLLLDINNHYHVFIRGSGGHIQNNIELLYNRKSIFKITINGFIKILEILADSKVSQYYLNHTVNIDSVPASFKLLTDFFVTKNIKPTLYLHDYFFICPTINLINDKKQYCGVPENLEVCNNCLAHNKDFIYIPLEPKLKMQVWRDDVEKLLMQCKVIYSFSDVASTLLLKAYPDIYHKIQLYTLNLKKMERIVNFPDFTANKVINIGLLGVITFNKGLKIIQQLSAQIIKSGAPFKITVIGEAHEPIIKAKIYGAYQKQDLPKICRAESIDLFVVPSVWPETYCYTADEIMSMGYPVICFNIGAQAQRICKYEHGLVIDQLNSQGLFNGLVMQAEKYGFKLRRYSRNSYQIVISPLKYYIILFVINTKNRTRWALRGIIKKRKIILRKIINKVKRVFVA